MSESFPFYRFEVEITTKFSNFYILKIRIIRVFLHFLIVLEVCFRKIIGKIIKSLKEEMFCADYVATLMTHFFWIKFIPYFFSIDIFGSVRIILSYFEVKLFAGRGSFTLLVRELRKTWKECLVWRQSEETVFVIYLISCVHTRALFLTHASIHGKTHGVVKIISHIKI